MHIITGLAIAGLSGAWRKRKLAHGFPTMRTGPLRLAHAVPGRVRLVAPLLKGVPESELPWLEGLRAIDGIHTVDVNAVSGSIVIAYAEGKVKPPILFAALVRLLGLEDEMNRPPSPLIARELRQFADSLNRAVYEETRGVLDLWSVLMIGLAILGTKKLAAMGWAAFPAGFTLMWWALNGLSREAHIRHAP